MELFVLSLFSALIVGSLLFHVSILLPLLAGLHLFGWYGLKKGFSLRQVVEMSINGVKTAKNVLIAFFLIGILTALWRSAGTIPVIICYVTSLIHPAVFLAMTFWLNCLISVLTGTSFGTSATMGVICAAMAATMNIPMVLVGGAVLSGAFFGDRCSPVSTSALLVSEVTGTSIFSNIRSMVRTALLPFLLSSLLYLVIGLRVAHEGAVLDLESLFSREFVLHWWALLPAAVILTLSLCRVNVRRSMSASIAAALLVCLLLQHRTPMELLTTAVFGFTAGDPEVAAMLSGGGIRSMLKVGAIVCLSSSYSGLFQKTGLLDSLKSRIGTLSRVITPYGAILTVSVLVGMLACNQTLTIMLTQQLCQDLNPRRESLALDLEDTAVVTSPLIPWSIAGAVPLAAVGAPASSILFSFFLYLLPLCRLFGAVWQKKNVQK